MNKGLIMSVLVAMTLAGMPAKAAQMENVGEQQQMMDDQKVSISVQNSSIVVNGAAGYEMEVISLTGRRVLRVRIESNSQRVELNVNKGCYIVKIENQSKKDSFVRKVTII